MSTPAESLNDTLCVSGANETAEAGPAWSVGVNGTSRFELLREGLGWMLCYRFGDEAFRLYPDIVLDVVEVTSFVSGSLRSVSVAGVEKEVAMLGTFGVGVLCVICGRGWLCERQRGVG